MLLGSEEQAVYTTWSIFSARWVLSQKFQLDRGTIWLKKWRRSRTPVCLVLVPNIKADTPPSSRLSCAPPVLPTDASTLCALDPPDRFDLAPYPRVWLRSGRQDEGEVVVVERRVRARPSLCGEASYCNS